jgi:hypothetical protein
MPNSDSEWEDSDGSASEEELEFGTRQRRRQPKPKVASPATSPVAPPKKLIDITKVEGIKPGVDYYTASGGCDLLNAPTVEAKRQNEWQRTIDKPMVRCAFAPHPPFRLPCITFSPTVSPFWCCRDRRCAPKSAVTEL